MSRPLLIVALALAVACGREVVFVDPPPASSTDTTGTDTTGTDTTVVQRMDLQVTVTIAPADTALAARLGFVNGRLSNAQVTARRVARQQGPQSGVTDSLGQVTLPGLIEGTWAISALRSLSEDERASLDSANRDVTGFAGAAQAVVEKASPEVTIQARAGRAGTLVISEIYMPVDNLLTGYALGQYIEVHNNAFDTLYLDGKVLGSSLTWVWDEGIFPCSASVRWREDPEGVWTRSFWAFPGAGRTYPLPPGGSAVVAVDAIDHRAVNPDLLDLSTADFEFIGASDVDNPTVPNMHNFPGWSGSGSDPIGHGPFWSTMLSIFLSEPFDPASLERDNLPLPSPLYVRIPRDNILDVVTSGAIPAMGESYCENFVHPTFDGRFAELINPLSLTYAIERKPLLGWLLQRNRVSAADFAAASPSPGRTP